MVNKKHDMPLSSVIKSRETPKATGGATPETGCLFIAIPLFFKTPTQNPHAWDL
jgi:hypothetical protein